MPGRKTRKPTTNEAIHEYRMRERVERGEKISGDRAGWLDRRGTAANAGRHAEAQTRHTKHDQRMGD